MSLANNNNNCNNTGAKLLICLLDWSRAFYQCSYVVTCCNCQHTAFTQAAETTADTEPSEKG